MTELQEIFKSVRLKSISPSQAKAFNMIRVCRTASLGSHTEICTDCGSVNVSYNSYRNRHCPKCQHLVQQEWVDAQLAKLLPVGYFHVVFTIPQELNSLVFQNQKFLYSLLIKSAGHTLTELAKDSKYLSASIGVTTVLHTWKQNLSFHPHVHCIVPGGGLSNDGLRFVQSRKKFFIPAKVISDKFKGKFLHFLKRAYFDGKIHFFNETTKLSFRRNFLSFINDLYNMKWVAFCKNHLNLPGMLLNTLVVILTELQSAILRLNHLTVNLLVFPGKTIKMVINPRL